MSKALQDLSKIVSRLKKTIDQAIKPAEMKPLGDFMLNLIYKRTKLGYAVARPLGTKKKFVPLSDTYKDFRRKYSGLSSTTSASKSNLTLTGQMLDSLSVKKASKGTITIGPTGKRNIELAIIHAEGGLHLPKRIFNNLSLLEYQQTLRFYRTRFGDLLRKQRLIS